MRIRSVEVRTASDSHHNANYVTITTESGLVGLGEAYAAGPDLAVAETVRYLGEWLVGQDATRRERLWQLCYRGLRFPAGAVGWAAISGVDLALWDLAGKIADQPVYQLLGGAYRDRIWLYHDVVTSEPAEMAEEARAMAGDHGFTAFKLFPYAVEDDRLPWAQIIRLVTERVGGGARGGGRCGGDRRRLPRQAGRAGQGRGVGAGDRAFPADVHRGADTAG